MNTLCAVFIKKINEPLASENNKIHFIRLREKKLNSDSLQKCCWLHIVLDFFKLTV